MAEVRKGEYLLITGHFSGDVYRDGERLGHFWEDPKSCGYAVFRAGNSTPVARPKSVAGCIRKLTNGEWDGKP